MKFRNRVLRIVFTLVLIASALASVSASPGTEVGGPIISNTTWGLVHSPYIVVASIEVWEGVTLTVEPGVTVKFDSKKKMQVNGSLIARGTETQPIIFTSNQPNPKPGDWGNIEFTKTAVTTTVDANENYISGSVLQYCIVEHAGANAENAIDARSLLIDHCTVWKNNSRGIYSTGDSYVKNNTISNNSANTGAGIYAEATNNDEVTISSNTISGNSAIDDGGGVYIWAYEGSAVLTNNIVNDNSALDKGGGIYATAYDGKINIDTNTVSGNNRDGVYTQANWRGEITISGNTLRDNAGRGIHAEGNQGSAIVTDNALNGNTGTGIDTFAWYGTVTVNGNTVCSNTGRGIYAATDYAGQIIVADNTISGNTGGGIYAYGHTTFYYYSSCAKVIVNGNTISNNSTSGNGGGIYARTDYEGEVTITSNIVSNNSASGSGGGIYAYSHLTSSSCPARITVNNNTLSNNKTLAQGAGMYSYNSKECLRNTVIGNRTGGIHGGVEIEGTPQVHDNNFYGNTPYDVVVVSSSDVNGTNNYWGTVESVSIVRQIYDWYDDSARGKFLYVPYLQDPSSDAPFPPPTNLRANFQNGSAVLSWDGLPSFKTGWGYKAYYDSDSSLPPYDGIGLNEGNSPIDVGNKTSCVLTGLNSNKPYYFAVTSYDTEGRESWYSNVEGKTGGYQVYLPLMLKHYRSLMLKHYR